MSKVLIAYTERGTLVERIAPIVTLECLQDAVGGYIEPCAPAELKAKGIEMLANEEGLLYGLEVNENLLPFFFVGRLAFVAVDGEDFVGLTDDQVQFVKNWIAGLNEKFVYHDDDPTE